MAKKEWEKINNPIVNAEMERLKNNQNNLQTNADYSKIASTKKVSNADHTGYTEYGFVNGTPVSIRDVSYYDNGRRNPSTVGTLIPGASNPQEVQPLSSPIYGAVAGTLTLDDAKKSYLDELGKSKGGDGSDTDKPGAVTASFQPSQTYLQAMQYTQGLLDKLSSGRTSYSDKLDEIMAQISGRDKFSYDFNTDPMFLSALQSSMNQGRLAMQDTMGQASALTGGYGSSYGQAVGNQAYNAEIQKAYDNLPEFYGMALDAYNNETQGLLNQLDMYGTADANEYDRLANAYASNAQMAAQLYDQEYNNFWQTQNFNEDSRRWNAEFDYGKQRDNAADELAYAKLLASNQADAEKAAELKNPTASMLSDGVKAAEDGLDAYFEYSAKMKEQGYNTDIMDAHVEQNAQLKLKDLEFTKVKDTPINGFNGIDRNDVVEDSNGVRYTISELKKKLVEEGMPKNKAEEFCMKLTNLGIGDTYSRY